MNNSSKLKNKTILSVVIPVYNVEKYIWQLMSTLEGIADFSEFIFVNDGSTDDSAKLVTSFLKTSGIRGELITKSNSGLGAARNDGMLRASANWITFIDSDDFYWDVQCLKNLVDACEVNSPDVAIFRGVVFDDKNLNNWPMNDFSIRDKISNRHLSLVDPRDVPELFQLEPSSCLKLYKNSYLRKIGLFPVGLHYEDVAYNFRVFAKTAAVMISNFEIYAYRVNRPGKITESSSRRRFDMVKIFEQWIGEVAEIQECDARVAHSFNYLAKMLVWCAKYIEFDERAEYYRSLAGLVGNNGLLKSLLANKTLEIIPRYILNCLVKSDVAELVKITAGGYTLSRLVFFIMRHVSYGEVKRFVSKRLK